jgi:hypothetical protein
LLSISSHHIKSLKGYEDNIVKSLLAITNDENSQLIVFIYQILNKLINNVSIDKALIEKTLAETIKLVNSSKLSNESFSSVLEFLGNSSKKIDKKIITSHLETLLKKKVSNEHQAKAVAILAQSSGTDNDLLSKLTDNV